METELILTIFIAARDLFKSKDYAHVFIAIREAIKKCDLYYHDMRLTESHCICIYEQFIANFYRRKIKKSCYIELSIWGYGDYEAKKHCRAKLSRINELIILLQEMKSDVTAIYPEDIVPAIRGCFIGSIV